jgi:uncharacterized membrane protein (UPF0127 family)
MKKYKKTFKVTLVRNSVCIADQCVLADSFFSRLKGLLGSQRLSEGQGLWLRPCHDIHMWFMTFPIDVVFIRKSKNDSLNKTSTHSLKVNQVVVTSVWENLPPWKLLPVRDGNAQQTLELPTGTIQKYQVKPGDQLCIA